LKTINTLAVDFGASGGKAVLAAFDGNKLSCQEVHRFPNVPCHVFTNVYWNILSLFDNLKAALSKAVKAGGSVASLGIDSWASDFGVLDAQGNLLGNPYSYMDDRTLSVVDHVFGMVSPYELFVQTGIEPHHRFGLFQMLAMKRDAEHILNHGKTALFIPNLLGYFCTGHLSCEATQASTTVLYDPFARGWNQEVFDRFDLPNLFPKLNNHVSTLGTINDSMRGETNAGDVQVVNIPQHDSATAMLSASLSRGDTLFVSCGSWSIIGMYLDDPIVTQEVFEKKYSNQIGYGGRIMFVKNVLGHWIISRCMDEWARECAAADYHELESEALQDGFESSIDLGENWLNAKGSIPALIAENCTKRGMPAPRTPAQTYACVLNALSRMYKDVASDLEKITGRALRRVHIVGGGAQSEYLCRRIAAETELEVLAGPYQATAIGNIVAQLIALGEVRNEAEAETIIQNSFVVKRY